MSENKEDIAKRQAVLNKVNNEIESKRQELKVLDALYRSVIKKITNFSKSGIIKIDKQDRVLIDKLINLTKKL